ncbi:hypothetical protein Taro_005026 [Colocasia esculenta]|uniref:Uncharacterized protein n=1 Tax=Colocasia esculenta TaxID=4460 RepID=A0A843TTC9_COLES|nr:hypothetical protein [Colocasia esculenta]
MTKRQVESRQLRVQARLNYGEFEISDMNGQVYRIDVKDNDMEGEDNVLLYAQESHRSNDPQIIWELYVLEDLSRVAAICRESSELWRAHVPIFCMAVMEVHMPERV